MKRVSIAVCLLFAFFFASTAVAQDFYVTPEGGGTGSGWGDPATLAYALANAADNDVVWLAEGTYTNTTDPAFDIDTDGLTLYGGFTNGMATFAERDWNAYRPVLDGEGVRGVLRIGEDCILDGLVISNGYAQYGAGIYKSGTYTIEIRNCRILNNKMTSANVGPDGPAMYLASGMSTLITNTTISGNGDSLSVYVGTGRDCQGIYCNNENLAIRNCTISDNKPTDPFASRDSRGGAIYALGTGTLTVEDTTFTGNHTTLTPADPSGGGAIAVRGAIATTIRRCVFEDNVSGNYADNRTMCGGAIEVDHASASVLIDHCLFEGNVAGKRGYAGAGTKADGGALYVEEGTVAVSNCNFVGNWAGADGGAIAVHGGTLSVVNSILYTNAAYTRASDIALIGGTLNVSYTRLDGTASPTHIYDETGGITLSNVMTNDPLFADADAGDYHLRSPSGRWDAGWDISDTFPHSPCIDGGDPNGPPGEEVAPNGGRANVGRWGRTAEASKSPAVAPVIQNRTVSTNVNLATIRGELVDNDTVAAVTLYYGKNATVTNTDTAVAVYPLQQTGTVFEASLSGLEYTTTYYYRWYASNGSGSDWANTVSNFTTGAEPPGGGPTIIHVKKDAAGGGTGDNWFNAFTSLADAMDAVNNPNTNEIWVAAASYDDATVIVTEDVRIFGGFDGTETTRSQRDLSVHRALVNGAGIRQCMAVTGGTVVLDGLVITNGLHTGDGIGLHAGSGVDGLSLLNCTFTHNETAVSNLRGGGAAFVGCPVVMSNCVFDGNMSASPPGNHYQSGGGFYGSDADVTIVDCLFTNNGNTHVNSRDSYMGGACYMTGGSVAVTNTLFVDNKFYGAWTPGDGGGACRLYNVSPARFVECVFLRNRIAPGTSDTRDASGGAVTIEHSSSDVVFDRCLFVSNYTTRTESHGGAVYVEAGTVGITNCTFVNNRTDYQGGAIHVAGGILAVEDSILYDSAADTRGTDVSLAGGSATFSYCRLSGVEGTDAVYDGADGITLSSVMTNDPLFASATDYHLRSPSGRWNGSAFVTSDAFPHSPCIDAGNGARPVGDEVPDHGSRVNLGRYGGTAEASKSPNAVPEVENRGFTTNVNVAVVRGELVGNDAIAGLILYYGKAPTVTNTDAALVFYPPQQTGTVFETTLAGLDYGTTYYYRWYATNAYGEDWAGTVSNFATGSEPPGGGPTIVHVKETAAGSGNGQNWFNAFTSLADAMSAVNNPNTNEIWVAAGNYDDTTVTINDDVRIYGGFSGSETNRDERDVSANGRPVINGAGERRCMSITNGTVLLDGLSLTNGMLVSGATAGAGIYASGAGVDLTIVDCRIEHNRHPGYTLSGYGFGLYLNSVTCYITNSVIANNKYTTGYYGVHNGLGIYGSGASLSMVDCTVTNNVGAYWGTRNSEGGAMWFNNCTVGITNCTISDNQIGSSNGTTDGGGAAKIIGGSQVEFRNCVFKNNRTGYNVGQQAYGGCMILDTASTDVDLVNCTVVDSFARDEGGAFYVLNGNLLLKDCILWNNSCTNEGDSHNRGYDIKVNSGSVTARYSNLSGDKDSDTYIYVGGGSMTRGDGLQWVDPRFASDDDVHLKSTEGRWDPSAGGGSGAWTNDAQSSLCIDKGEPGDVLTYTNEPAPHGERVNLGAYGNTWQASRTPPTPAPVVTNIGHGVVYNYVTITGELVVVDTSADVSIYYGTNDWVWEGYFQPSPATQESGIPFSASQGDLDYNTTYYYRCFATNAGGGSWAGNVMSFLTGSEPAGGPDTVIHVKSDAAGSQSGATWFDACLTLAAALAKVDGPTNEIWIATSRETVTAEIDISTNVSIYGGFVGTENTRAERSPANVAELAGDGTLRIMDIGGGTVLLDGLTITNGAGGSSGYGLRAAGTYDLTLANCFFKRNGRTDSDDGAGAYFSGGTVLLTNTTFDSNGNGHGIQGGGFYAAGADVTVVDCLFTNNGTPGYNGRTSDGGAIYQSGGALTVIRSDFIGNDVGTDVNRYGGAVALVGNTSASFTNCVFRHNTCTFQNGRGDGSNGGAIGVVVNAGYTVTVVNCTFAYNTGANRGGAIHANSGATIIRNCILWGNEVSELAGAAATGEEIYARNAGTVVVIEYSDLKGTNGNFVVTDGTATIEWGAGVFSANPRFASATDLHLRSETGRWDPATTMWVQDNEFSPCIDAGDPDDDYNLEPRPHGKRLNLGAYGNTPHASMSNLPLGSMLLLR